MICCTFCACAGVCAGTAAIAAAMLAAAGTEPAVPACSTRVGAGMAAGAVALVEVFPGAATWSCGHPINSRSGRHPTTTPHRRPCLPQLVSFIVLAHCKTTRTRKPLLRYNTLAPPGCPTRTATGIRVAAAAIGSSEGISRTAPHTKPGPNATPSSAKAPSPCPSVHAARSSASSSKPQSPSLRDTPRPRPAPCATRSTSRPPRTKGSPQPGPPRYQSPRALTSFRRYP